MANVFRWGGKEVMYYGWVGRCIGWCGGRGLCECHCLRKRLRLVGLGTDKLITCQRRCCFGIVGTEEDRGAFLAYAAFVGFVFYIFRAEVIVKSPFNIRPSRRICVIIISNQHSSVG